MRTILFITVATMCVWAGNPALDGYMNELLKEAKASNSVFVRFDGVKGKELFYAQTGKAEAKSCTTCHTNDLKKSGQTPQGKTIEPLAPSVNRERLTDAAQMQKWLKRNCKQVWGRECSAEEKGNLLAFIAAQ